MAEDGPVYGKFNVSRTDGRDAVGGDKEGARYFVLDYINDKYAREALKFYAYECFNEMPELSSSIWSLLRNASIRSND